MINHGNNNVKLGTYIKLFTQALMSTHEIWALGTFNLCTFAAHVKAFEQTLHITVSE